MVEKPKPKPYYRKQANTQWALWRLVMSEKFSYTEVMGMDTDTMMEANAALDIFREAERKAQKQASKKKKG